MALIENIAYILIGFIALISIFLIILTFLEKKLKIRFMEGRFSRNELYIKKIAAINLQKPKESIKTLDKLARLFFKEAFHINREIDNSELEEFFKKKNNKKAIEFSEEMTKYLYSKEEITAEKLKELAVLLAEIISSNKILSKEEKEELDKKSREKDPKQHKSKIPLVGKFIKHKEEPNKKIKEAKEKGNPFKVDQKAGPKGTEKPKDKKDTLKTIQKKDNPFKVD